LSGTLRVGPVDRAAGRRGDDCVESLLALQIITDRPINAQDVSRSSGGDKMACVIIGEVGRYLGMAIANLINLLNVEMVVLGGGVIEAGEVWLKPTIEEVKRHALTAR
jgi:predicted NBD/HSP70 family sugar kinase